METEKKENGIEIYAPVVIITCNRAEHLRECVESLSRCTHAEKTEVYISVDYPPGEKYVEGWEKVKEYVTDIQGFKKVNVWIQETNLGPDANEHFVQEKAFEKYDVLIFTEDDNVFAAAYLDYMNQMLKRFEKDPRVYSIAGFNMLNVSSPSRIYKSYTFQPWGSGKWKDKWHYLRDLNRAEVFEKSSQRYLKIMGLYFRNKWLFCVYVSFLLKGDEAQKSRMTDAMLSLLFYLLGYYTVFPCKSLVKNNGFDGSGVTCRVGAVPELEEVELDDEVLFRYDDQAEIPITKKWYLPIPEWAKNSARLKNDPLTYFLYCVMGKEKYLAWRKKKGI